MEISKEMIRRGFQDKRISIEPAYGGCDSICCRVANRAFYFLNPAEYCSMVVFWKKYSMEKVVDMIHDILKDRLSADANGIFEDEWEFYRVVLL